MYHPSLLSKWDILLNSLIIWCCSGLQIPPLPSTCTICGYCCFLASWPHLVLMAMLRFHVWLLVHTSSNSRKEYTQNLTMIMMITKKCCPILAEVAWKNSRRLILLVTSLISKLCIVTMSVMSRVLMRIHLSQVIAVWLPGVWRKYYFIYCYLLWL